MKTQDWLKAETDHLILALVFTDVVDSTGLQRRLGDQEYHVIRRLHFAKAKKLIEQWGGHEVKNSGDSFFAVFRTAIAAFNFAMSLHDDTGDPQIKIRAGVHVGTVRIEEDGDIFGTPANYTNRVMNVAKLGGVMLSRDAKSQIDFEKAPEHSAIRYEELVVGLSGLAGRHQVFKTFTPGIIAARRKRADNQSLPSKIFYGSHDRPKEVPPPITPPLQRKGVPINERSKLSPTVRRALVIPPDLGKTDDKK
jgi:class 3 adenylate cyclase